MNTATAGGYLNFYDNSTAAQSEITLRAGTNGITVQFYNNATAADAQIITETGAGNPGNIYLRRQLHRRPMPTFLSARAASWPSMVSRLRRMRPSRWPIRAQVSFSGGSAGQAQITAAGGSTYTAGSQAFIHFIREPRRRRTPRSPSTAHRPRSPPPLRFRSPAAASPGNATLIANGGTNGGAGGTILFNGAANGSTARIIANAGGLVDFFSQAIYNDISFGSIEGAGTFGLRGAHVITGSRNTSTTVSGPIVDTLVYPTYTGGRLTKVGTGTLTLAGANTYSGLTTVNAGTLSVTGSIAGGAVVNNGGTLNGTGTSAAGVTVNSGGVFAPGTSPGTITVGGLTMTPGGTLNFELGPTAYDHIVASGNASLAGILNVSLVAGFTPTAGSTFNILDWGTITGTFTSLTLPSLAGLSWNTSQLYTSGVLSIVSASLPGDFNNNGVVDAADYVAWRKTDGAPAGYNLWRAHFGQTAGLRFGCHALGTAVVRVPPSPSQVHYCCSQLLLYSQFQRRRACGRFFVQSAGHKPPIAVVNTPEWLARACRHQLNAFLHRIAPHPLQVSVKFVIVLSQRLAKSVKPEAIMCRRHVQLPVTVGQPLDFVST